MARCTASVLYISLVAHVPQDLQLMVRSNYVATLWNWAKAAAPAR